MMFVGALCTLLIAGGHSATVAELQGTFAYKTCEHGTPIYYSGCTDCGDGFNCQAHGAACAHASNQSVCSPGTWKGDLGAKSYYMGCHFNGHMEVPWSYHFKSADCSGEPVHVESKAWCWSDHGETLQCPDHLNGTNKSLWDLRWMAKPSFPRPMATATNSTPVQNGTALRSDSELAMLHERRGTFSYKTCIQGTPWFYSGCLGCGDGFNCEAHGEACANIQIENVCSTGTWKGDIGAKSYYMGCHFNGHMEVPWSYHFKSENCSGEPILVESKAWCFSDHIQALECPSLSGTNQSLWTLRSMEPPTVLPPVVTTTDPATNAATSAATESEPCDTCDMKCPENAMSSCQALQEAFATGCASHCPSCTVELVQGMVEASEFPNVSTSCKILAMNSTTAPCECEVDCPEIASSSCQALQEAFATGCASHCPSCTVEGIQARVEASEFPSVSTSCKILATRNTTMTTTAAPCECEVDCPESASSSCQALQEAFATGCASHCPSCTVEGIQARVEASEFPNVSTSCKILATTITTTTVAPSDTSIAKGAAMKMPAVAVRPSALPCTTMPKAVCSKDSQELCVYDETCSAFPPRRGGLGCNAGGVGQNCRFCGFKHYLPCDEDRADTTPACSATPAPVCAGLAEPCYLDYQCSELPPKLAGLGCNAGGMRNCRFCGFGAYPPCPGAMPVVI